MNQRGKRKRVYIRRCKPLFNLVRLAGIEPTTPWFVAKYSIQLSYSREAVDCSTGFWAVAMVLKKSVISLQKCTTAAVPLHPFAFRWCTLDPKAWIHRPYWAAQVLQTPSSRFTSLEMFHANHIPCLQTRKADLVISTLGKKPRARKVIDFTSALRHLFTSNRSKL